MMSGKEIEREDSDPGPAGFLFSCFYSIGSETRKKKVNERDGDKKP
jgi:hypothetical protein